MDPSCKGKAIGAFIVFNCEDSQKRCVEEFEYSQHGYYRMFQPMHMRLPRADKKFGVPLRVDVATTPSLVYWENLHVSDGERYEVAGSEATSYKYDISARTSAVLVALV